MPSDIQKRLDEIRNKFLGFEETSSVKTYYPQLREKIIELEKSETFLRDKSKALLNILEDLETEKKKTQESEERYALAQKAANIGSWDWNMLTDDLDWTELVIPMFGIPPGQIKGTMEDFWSRLHPDDIPMIEQKVKATIDNNEDYRVEHRVIHPDGSIRWMLETGDVIRNQDGLPIRMIGVIQDITNRKEAEEKLKASEEKYRKFFEEDLSGVFVSTPEGILKACNPAYARMMEYDSVEDLLASSAIEHYEQPQDRIDFLNLLREKRKLVDYEGSIVTKKGHHVDTLENIIGVFDDNDKLVEFWGYVNDITARKKAEFVLKNAAKEKEALHRELLHRVKNSFALIKSLVYLERQGITDEKSYKLLENLEYRIASLSHMYSILNETGVSQTVELDYYLNQITKALIDSYIETENKVSIKSSFDKINVSPKDASSIGLIVNELLTNSIKYAFNNNVPGEVLVSLKKLDNTAVLSIYDNGRGLPEGFNIEDSTGMGLQLVRMLTEQLSGKIEVDGKNGTTFKIILPLKA